MKFRTEAPVEPASHPIKYADRIVSLGSCFAEEIGDRLSRALFTACCNPLGPLFNPISICQMIDAALEDASFPAEDFFQHQELWRHFLVHSKLASTDRENARSIASSRLQELRKALQEADHLLITLGSAWAYRQAATGQLVAHNHRLPLELFEKRLLTVEETSAALIETLQRLLSCRPKLRVQVTVSPVRHIRDGLHANNLSKSVLLLAAEALVQSSEQIRYFPAYEILIDDLRDYRFYDQDLAHASPAAIDYIWQQFAATQLSAEAQAFCSDISSIQAALSHRPSHSDTQAHQQNLDRIATRIDALAKRGINVTKLKKSLSKAGPR